MSIGGRRSRLCREWGMTLSRGEHRANNLFLPFGRFGPLHGPLRAEPKVIFR